MRRKKVWRYWCDFCNKGGCSGGAIAKHEKHCTANPKRHCRVCDNADLEQKPIAELIAALGSGDKEGVDNLRDLAEGCPACMLAASRQSGLNQPPDEEGLGHWVEFSYRKESEAFWAELNHTRAEADELAEYYANCG